MIEIDMIDRVARKAAADLVRLFRDGQLTNYQLESAWPHNPSDRALVALESMLWRFYDDHREHGLIGRHAPDDCGKAELTRYAAFLDTGLPYQWSKDNFVGIGGLGLLVPLSLGLLWPVDRWIKLRQTQSDERLGTEGDLSVWPFISAIDYGAALANEVR